MELRVKKIEVNINIIKAVLKYHHFEDYIINVIVMLDFDAFRTRNSIALVCHLVCRISLGRFS